MTNPAHILLVDDDVELAGLLRDYLVRDGFTAEAVPDGESGVAAALSGRFAIVVLDVMMPGIGGIEALRRIRAASTVPVLMLTARGDDFDRTLVDFALEHLRQTQGVDASGSAAALSRATSLSSRWADMLASTSAMALKAASIAASVSLAAPPSRRVISTTVPMSTRARRNSPESPPPRPNRASTGRRITSSRANRRDRDMAQSSTISPIRS